MDYDNVLTHDGTKMTGIDRILTILAEHTSQSVVPFMQDSRAGRHVDDSLTVRLPASQRLLSIRIKRTYSDEGVRVAVTNDRVAWTSINTLLNLHSISTHWSHRTRDHHR